MSASPSMNSPTASPTFSFTGALPLLPLPMSIYKAKVSVKLDEKKENFLVWRLLVESVIKGHRLHMFLTDSAIGYNAGSNNDGFDQARLAHMCRVCAGAGPPKFRGLNLKF
jgi:hypothetical protein